MREYNPAEIARMYDAKMTNTGDLNNLLAEKGGKVFNHLGILLPGLPMPEPKTEDELLELLNQMETDLVEYTIPHLGKLGSTHLLLDAGCGAGGTALMIYETFGCRIEGVNLSSKQVEFAAQATERLGLSEHLRFIVADVLKLPCEDGHYDAVWACESTQGLPDLKLMYTELARATKPSGRLVIVDFCATDTPEGQSIKVKVDNHYGTCMHTREEYTNSAEQNGWVLAEAIDMTGLTAPYWRLRSSSAHGTGSESFMTEGFLTGNLEYYLLAFERSARN
jgi:geranyl diphosphate 2-C-methyltransferase